MLRSLWLVLVYASFLGLGLAAPFVAALGYVWVDATTPQSIAWFILPSLPVAQIMGAGAFFSYLLLDRRDPPRPNAALVLTVLLALWVTLTTAGWAVVPDAAWVKWSWAFKAVAFSAFLPFVFRSRVQIEAFLQVLVFSAMANILAPGVKTLVSGGGYHSALGFVTANTGFGEGGFLSTVALMIVPTILFLRRHSVLMPRLPLVGVGYLGLVVACVSCAIGTYERSALVGLAVLGVALWWHSRRKVVVGGLLMTAAVVIGVTVSGAWQERISTIQTYKNDNSALTRLAVWQWTLEFAASQPLGGGFDVYRIDTIHTPPTPTEPEGGEQHGRAFHSIYFEMLGEQGWVGLGLFGGVVLSCFLSLRRVARYAAGDPALAWCRDLSTALSAGLATYLACGAFVGIGFQPMLWYMVAASICLSAHVRRLRTSARREIAWRPSRGETGVTPLPAWRQPSRL
ncbi:MAG: putative O-glycosylation ligase, exosortase A system-associated [Pseudomonadota bacterium]|nr:putative O-glycosylation ligase, exosortase A system-associated [Pseudomonadota bacterium]